MDVGDCSEPLLVDNDLHLPIIDVVLLEETADEEARVVSGCIVDYDHVVVGVLLIEDGLEVELVAEGFGIVVSRHDDAEGQLTVIPAQMVRLLQPPLLLLEQLLHPPQIVTRRKLIAHIGLLHQPVVLAHLAAEVIIVGQLLKLPHPLLPNALLHLVLQQIQQNMVVGHIPLQTIQPLLVAQLHQGTVILRLLNLIPYLLLDNLDHLLDLQLLPRDSGHDHLILLAELAGAVDELTLERKVLLLDGEEEGSVLGVGLRKGRGLVLEEDGDCDYESKGDSVEEETAVLGGRLGAQHW